MRNGTDRDIALQIVADMETISEKVAAINTNLYHVVILTQPTDQTVAMNATCTFTVSAANVTAYEWQYLPSGGSWTSASGYPASYQTATLTFTVTNAGQYTRKYRCKMTGKDGEDVYTNEVTILAPESNG